MKGIIWVVVIVIVVILGFVFLGGSPEEATGEPITIGLSAPLSGEGASYGESARAGVLLAQKEINESGGIDGRPVEVVFEDDQCTPAGISAMQKLVNVDQVTAVIGPVCSSVAGAAVPVAREANMPTILIGASAPGLAGGPDSIFSGYPSDAFQGKFAAEYIFDELGDRKVAVLYVNNDWGVGLKDVFVDRFSELGGEIVFNEGVSQGTKDMRSQVTKIKAASPDLVYIPLYPEGAVVAVKQLKDAGVEATIFGGDALVGDEFLQSGVGEGVMLTSGAVGNTDSFKKKITDLTGVEPNIIAPLGYDALMILAEVIEDNGTEKESIISGLNSISYRKGESFPRISFDENGDLSEANYEVKVVKDGAVVLVE